MDDTPNDREMLVAEREAERIGRQTVLDSAMLEARGRTVARFAAEMFRELERQGFIDRAERLQLVCAALRSAQ